MLAIYCRISGNKAEGKDTSIETQSELGIEFARKNGFEYKLFIEPGISGNKDKIKDRPQFSLMINGIEDGSITDVYVLDQSRLERNNEIWAFFVSFVLRHDCNLYMGGILQDLDIPEHKMYLGMASLTNQYYSENKSREAKRSIQRRAKQGRFRGLTAYGYQNDGSGKLLVKEDEAHYVKLMYQLSLDGLGTYTIANRLNQLGVSTKFNHFKGDIKRRDPVTQKVIRFRKDKVKWRGNVVHDILRNPIYKGKKRLNKEYYDVESIVTEELWEKVNSNLKRNKKKVGRKATYHYLLNGIIHCAHCGHQLVGRKRKSCNDNSYKCRKKVSPHERCDASRGINLTKLDSFIIKLLFKEKELKNHLLSLPKDESHVESIRSKLSKSEDELKKITSSLSLALERLMDVDLKNDESVKLRYTETKELKRIKEEEIESLKHLLNVSEAHKRAQRIKSNTEMYFEGIAFEDLKNLILQIIERIEVRHEKEEGKMGHFLIQLDFHGFEERAVFMTSWRCDEWTWISRYRSKAVSNDDLKDDRDVAIHLLKQDGIKNSAQYKSRLEEGGFGYTKILDPFREEFEGFESSSSGGYVLRLNKSDLIDFNQPS